MAPVSQTGANLASDAQRIFRSLQCVSNSGPSSVGGGGARLAPAAPPLRPRQTGSKHSVPSALAAAHLDLTLPHPGLQARLGECGGPVADRPVRQAEL